MHGIYWLLIARISRQRIASGSQAARGLRSRVASKLGYFYWPRPIRGHEQLWWFSAVNLLYEHFKITAGQIVSHVKIAIDGVKE